MQNTMGMNDMVVALVKQPTANRKAMMTDRMEMFAEMDDDRRKQAMGAMLDALYALPDGDFQKMVDTRTAVLADLDDLTRKKLMKTHMALLQQQSESERMREMKTVQASVQKLPPEKRKPMMQMMQNMMPAGAAAMGASSGGKNEPARTQVASTASVKPSPAATPASSAPVTNTWAAWLTVVLGGWVAISPFLFASNSTGQLHGVILGAIIAVLALIGALSRQAWADWLNVVAGLWLIVGSFILGLDGTLQVSTILAGIAVAILSYIASTGAGNN